MIKPLSSLPKYFLMPYDRNPHFTGRDELLTELRDKLDEAKPKAYNHRVAVHGMGGVGKTQLAIEYVHRYKALYDGIFWISAVDNAELLSGFQEIGSIIGCVAATDLNLTERVKIVLSWLQQEESWLLIIDNLDDISVVDGYLPQIKKGGHTLITTRYPESWNIPAEGIETPVLGEETAIELLCLRSRIINVDQSPERRQAAEIVKELGYLALAIEHASAYIRSSIGGISQFLSMYRQSRKRMHNRKSGANSSYPKSIAATFLLSLDKIKEGESGMQTIKLLQLFVFLNPDGILIDFLRSGRKGLSNERREVIEDELVFEDALKSLHGFSLIGLSQKKDSIVIHRLIQAVIRDELTETDDRNLRTEVIEISRAAFPETVTNETRELCRRFQGQVRGPVYEAAEVRSPSASAMIYTIGRFLLEDGKFEDAERFLKLGLDHNKTLLGNEHPNTLANMEELGMAYGKQGRWDDAVKVLEKVLEVRIRVLGEEHLDTLRAMGNLAAIYRVQGRRNDTVKLKEKVLEVRIRVLGEEHLDTLTAMANLAAIYYDQGRWNDALKLKEKVLEARIRLLGEEHPDTLTTMANLAAIYHAQGRWNDKVKLKEKVLEARIRLLGEEHPDTVRATAHLAVAYHDQGRWNDAVKLNEKVLEAKIRLLGEEHPETLTAMANLAATYQSLGRLDASMVLLAKTTENMNRVLGTEHPTTLWAMEWFALGYKAAGKLHEALSLQEKLVDGRKRVLGNEHPITVASVKRRELLYREISDGTPIPTGLC
jgi:tetratricopeptide (TPR) repeat protein